MAFKLKGIMWEIRLALRSVGSVKDEIVVKDIDEIHKYLAKYHRMDAEEVKKIIESHDGKEH